MCSHFLHFILSASWNPRCFSEIFFFFWFHLCSCWESNRACTHANTLHSRVSQWHQLLHGVTHILCYASFFPSPVDPWGPKEEGGKRNPVVYIHFLSVLIVWGGTWTVIPAENNTSFSPVKPSVRPHHREQALRIRDIISLPGKVAHSIFPATLHCGLVLWWWLGRWEKKTRTRKRSQHKATTVNVWKLCICCRSALSTHVFMSNKSFPGRESIGLTLYALKYEYTILDDIMHFK